MKSNELGLPPYGISIEEGKIRLMEKMERLDRLARVSHNTWMRQAAQSEKWKGQELPQEPFLDDRKRAADALRILEKNKPTTREEAVRLISISSHKMWMQYTDENKGKQMENLGPDPNDHDKERAEDIVSALESEGFLKFEK